MDFLYTAHVVFIFVLVLFTHLIGIKSPRNIFVARKILHIGAILTVAHATFITPTEQLHLYRNLILIAAIVLTMAVWRGFFKIEGRKSWGIAYFPWVLYVLLWIQPNRLEITAISFAVLAVSDGFSALAGRYFAPPEPFKKYNATINGKTWMGFAVFTISCWILLGIVNLEFLLQKNDGSTLFIAIIALFLVSITTAMVELISKGGTDNLWVPLWGFLMLVWIGRLSFWVSLFSAYLPLIFLVALLVWRKKWLSVDGLFMSILLATVVLLAGVNMIPLLIFFLLGSLSSKINHKANTDAKHGKPRDMWQVLANGGWVGFLAIAKGLLLKMGLLTVVQIDFAVILIMSAALGDTLSSEIGMRWGKNPFSITTGKAVPAGISGGVSIAGLAGALFGGVLMAIYAVSFYSYNHMYLLFVVCAALGGSLIDSLLGDRVQEKFERKGKLSDVGSPEEKISGVRGMNNDAVNACSLGVVLLLYIALQQLFVGPL